MRYNKVLTSTRGRGRPVDDPAKQERRPSRQARPNLSKPDGLRIKKRMGHEMPHPLFKTNVYERIRTSDPSLRSSKRRPRELYQISSKTAYFRAFFRVPVLCQDRFLSLFFALLSSKLLQLCCKPQNFNEWLA